MKNNTSILFSLLMTLALSTHVNGSADSNYDHYDTDSANDDESTYNDAMSRQNDYEMAEHILADEKHKLGAQFVLAAKNNNLRAIQNLLNCDIDPNFQDADGNTANHYITQHAINAAHNKQSFNIKEYASTKWQLYKNGATDDILNNNGVTVEDINKGIGINAVKIMGFEPISTKK